MPKLKVNNFSAKNSSGMKTPKIPFVNKFNPLRELRRDSSDPSMDQGRAKVASKGRTGGRAKRF